MAVFKNPIIRNFLFFIGILSVILGAIGVFIPLLPTTPFILLAAWCFIKSSPKAHSWIHKQPLLGHPLKKWEERGAISKSSKALALIMISISIGIILYQSIPIFIKIVVSLFLLAISTFIISRPNN